MIEDFVVSLEFELSHAIPHNILILNPPDYDVNEVSPAARESNLSFQYSGRHDHGQLPLLKNTGPLSRVLSSLVQAKKECDGYLTDIISTQSRVGVVEEVNVQEIIGESLEDIEEDEAIVIEKKPRLEDPEDV